MTSCSNVIDSKPFQHRDVFIVFCFFASPGIKELEQKDVLIFNHFITHDSCIKTY